MAHSLLITPKARSFIATIYFVSLPSALHQQSDLAHPELSTMAPLLSEEEIALGDPYEILGVPVDSTEKQIQSAYRKLSIKSHPDRVSKFTGPLLIVCGGLMLFCLCSQFPNDEEKGQSIA